MAKLCALFFATLLSTWAQSATAGADLARAIRETGLDTEQCFRVRDLAFTRDDIKLFFNDGFLIFSKLVAGERITAVFATGDEDPDDGELLLLPPWRDERQSLAKYTRTPNLDEHFENAFLTFTDGTARMLLREIEAVGRPRPEPGVCSALAARWDPVVTNLNDSLAQRITGDLLSPVRPGGGFLFVALQGKTLGTFDVVFDPIADDQILMGQLAEHAGALSFDVWTSFPARSIRLGSAAKHVSPYTVTAYEISAALDESLSMKAVTRVRLRVGDDPGRVLSFGISRAETVTSARLDGQLVEVVFRESARTRALRADENDLFLVVAPGTLEPGSTHELVMEHQGDVIADRGSGVYSVGARSNWYPRLALEFAAYDLEFRYPKGLTLVTAGEIVSERTEGDFRVTRRRTPVPIRVAGFNLGNYERLSHAADGITVNVYGNRGLDPALAPKPKITLLPQSVRPLYRGGGSQVPQTTTIIQTPPAPDPLGRIEAVAADISDSLHFFSAAFGPPPLKTLTVSPIPGTQGQGFPGLIYLSTLSYLEEAQRPQSAQDRRHQTFFSDLMAAHEVAHQWWGNVVAAEGYQDEWLMEGLAHYSAMMWLEKKRGAVVMQAELDAFRADLLAPGSDGTTVDGFGPLTWGYRLEAARTPDTWRVITYEKGAWIFHMLRRRLGDQPFLAMLGELRRRYEYRAVSTQALQMLVKEFAGPGDFAEEFFDHWVRSSGIPAVRVRFSTSGRVPSVRVSGTVSYEQSPQRGVTSDFATEIPLEITLPNGTRRIEWVRSSDRAEPFSFTLPQAPTKISLATGATLATER